MKRKLSLYIKDIKASIKKIEKYAKGYSFEDFLSDEKTLDAIVRNLEIIGEAAKNVPDNVKSKFLNVPWKEIIGMRNKVIHEYFGIDYEILWETIKEDIPQLKKQIAKIKT